MTGCSQTGGGSKPQASSASSVQAEPDDVDEADEFLSNQPLYHMTNEELQKVDAMVDEIVKNPQVKAGSKPEQYIEAKSDVYNQIVALGEKILLYMPYDIGSSQEDGLKEYVMASICADISGKYNGPNKTWSTGKEWEKLYDNIPWGKALPKGVELPRPNVKFVHKYYDQISCLGLVRADMDAYIQSLIRLGWRRLINRQVSWPETANCGGIYIKDNVVLTLTDNVGDSGSKYSDYTQFSMQIIRFYDQNIARKEALPLDKARQIITDYQEKNPIEGDSPSAKEVKAVFEFDIPGLSKMKIQLYRAYLSNGGYGDFWISSKGDKIGRIGIPQNVVVADIDNDGRYELVTCSISGSGNVRLFLLAYRFTDKCSLVYHGVWLLNTGGIIKITKSGRNGVHLWDTWELPDKVLKTADYGMLNFKNGKVTIQEGVDFPHKQDDTVIFHE